MGTLVLVADASRARLFTSDRRFTEMALVETIDHAEGRLRASELVSDGRGRSHAGPGGVGAAMDARTDPAEVEEEHFARALAHRLGEAVDHQDVRHIALVAPPRFLGRLRHLAPPAVKQRVFLEIDRDYTKASPVDLPALMHRHQ